MLMRQSLLLQRVCRINPKRTLDKGYMKLLLQALVS